ncbi:hypothetical protein Mal4_34000 [Maioricimonas rarisocia]|uniref:Uncharacterized protein n=1 Tax=Maioricimonas rarisocia TaxID=2528026 RepID=A0A517Z9B0_9PLAN|nr:hypothetical protein [Maioricimonas rarisocia]QDU39065.1 hypothetical protein Mal4_34000 [Maioricimonas rarisocia]
MTSATIATALITSAFLPVRLEGPAAQAWFLSVYPAAAAHGEEVYDRLMIDIRSDAPEIRGESAMRTVRSTTFDGQLRLDVFRNDFDQFAESYILTAKDSVIVRRVVNDNSRTAVAVESCPAESLLSTIRNSFPFPFAPWHVGERTILEMLTDNQVVIWHVCLTIDPRHGCVCEVDWSDAGKAAVPPYGRFRFAVDRGWVLLSSVRMVSPRYGSVVRIAYDDHEIDDIPVIRTSEHSVIQAGQRIVRRRFHRESFVALESSPETFDTTVYRIAAALSPQVSATTSPWYSVIPVVMGVCLLTVCVQGWRLESPPESVSSRECPDRHSENVERNRKSRE